MASECARHFSGISRTAKLIRLGSSAQTNGSKCALRRSWSSSSTIPITAPLNAWQFSADKTQWNCTRVWSIWSVMRHSFKHRIRYFRMLKTGAADSYPVNICEVHQSWPFSQRWSAQNLPRIWRKDLPEGPVSAFRSLAVKIVFPLKN